MKQKEPTKAQLKQKLRSAYLFVPKDKESKSVYFDDRGLRLSYTMDFAIVETGAHRHVFSAITSQGFSRPYLYIKQFTDIAANEDCTVKDAKGETTRSYGKLMDILSKKDNDKDYNLALYVDKYLFNIFSPLYSIDESPASAFIVYEQYLHNVARMESILAEKTEDVTNKQYVDTVVEKLKEFLSGIPETVLFHKLTDDELAKQEMEAMQEQETDEAIKEEAQQ